MASVKPVPLFEALTVNARCDPFTACIDARLTPAFVPNCK